MTCKSLPVLRKCQSGAKTACVMIQDLRTSAFPHSLGAKIKSEQTGYKVQPNNFLDVVRRSVELPFGASVPTLKLGGGAPFIMLEHELKERQHFLRFKTAWQMVGGLCR